MVDKNEYVNDILKPSKKDTNDKTYFKRIGKCNYKKCQAACCRFECFVGQKEKKKAQYHTDYNREGVTDIRHINGYDVYIKPKWCDKITLDGKCVLHNNRRQPNVCKYFPMHPTIDGMYLAVKHLCGYKFIELKNPYYNPKKEMKEEPKAKNGRSKRN